VALELRQTLKLTQQLVMTPQLQQAIKLLQLSRLELADVIQHELQENCMLVEEPAESSEDNLVVDASGEVTEPFVDSSLNENFSAPEKESPSEQEFPEKMDWKQLLEYRATSDYRGGFAEDEEKEEGRRILKSSETLADHLLWQMQVSGFSPQEQHIGEALIGNVDDDGYIRTNLDELAEKLQSSISDVEGILERIQQFDPPGVAARDLIECLINQMNQLGINDPIMHEIIRNHLHDLETKNYKKIAQDLKKDMETILAAAKHISMLEPKPGRPFGGTEPQYITPDIYVYKVGDEFIIVLNDDGLPRLRISNYYKQILYNSEMTTEKEREYIQDKLRSAVWLIRSIHQRQRTIYKVMKSIIQFQRDFFDKGITCLRPMILRDVAEDISMHESTISRVTTNKYVHTPQGIFELKFFFNSGLSSEGDDVASESVKDHLKKIITKESPSHPYSDQEIVRIIKNEHGINIARRTVTKYREALGILSSTKRKRFF